METIAYKPLNSIWLKAAVVGSIWASVEIILGSFLHNMKLPLSGMILSLISVWLLISFLQIWKEKGLIWRAGLICALMKSISPSAFIFGPMIGIFSEALLINFFIFILGRNLIAYSIAGAFAVLSSLFQKVISLLILYGFDFIKILADLYKYAVKQIGLEHLSALWLLTIITGIYVVTGVTGAIGGYLTGSKYLKTMDSPDKESPVILEPASHMYFQTGSQRYSLLFLMISLFSIAGILLLINSDNLILTSVLSVAYIAFCIYNYRNSLKRLKKVSFWISFLIITFAAAFLWSGFQKGALFTIEGLLIGLKMNARAIIMMIGFASVSIELRNPVIKSLLYNRGFANLYQAMTLAFTALPFLIADPSGGKDNKRFPVLSFQRLLNQAQKLESIFEKDHLIKPPIVIITGEIHEGKTTFVQETLKSLSEEKIKVTGFLSLAINENGERAGFNLYDIETGGQIELCSSVKDDMRLHLGRYYFNQAALSKGDEILNSEKLQGTQLIVIDEVGNLELKGEGWCSAIENITKNDKIPQLWVVRKNLLPMVTKRWNTGDIYIFDIKESSTLEVKNKIIEIISQIDDQVIFDPQHFAQLPEDIR